MKLATIRSALRPQAAVRRTVLLCLLGVVAVVAGLLAMHTLSVDAPTHAPVAAVSSAEPHAEHGGGAADPSPSDACGPAGCAPGHAMGLMACVLALLAVALLLVAAPTASRWRARPPRLARPLLSAIYAAVPAPPSLTALSISRT